MSVLELTLSTDRTMRIETGPTGANGKVTVDGEDIGIPLVGIDISIRPQRITSVTLHLLATHLGAGIDAPEVIARIIT